MAAAVALKAATVAPAATVTDAGAERRVLLLASKTVIPPGGAAVFRLPSSLRFLPGSGCSSAV